MCARTEAGPTGGGGAWPGFETTHRATYQRPGATVWRAPERSAAVPVGGGGAWPGFETSAERSSRRGRPGPPAPGTPAAPQASTRSADGSRAGRHPPAHTAAEPSGARNTSGAQHTSGITRHVGITKPPGPTGAGRLSQYQRLIAGPRRCRGLRGRSPGERWKYQAWRQRPSRSPPCGDPRRRRWRSAWPSRQRSRRRCPRSRPG